MRQWCERRGWKLPYEWKAELQKRGAVHYHLLIWMPLRLCVKRYEFDSLGWWPHGMTQFVWARCAARYISKYCSKAQADRFPKGLRMHGAGGVDAECRRELRYKLLPKYVREVFVDETADVVRAKGGGWLEKSTGEWIPAIPLVIDWSS